MKVLIVITYFLPYRSGLTLHAQRLAEELVKVGQEVTVLCYKHNRRLKDEEIINGVKIIRINPQIKVSRGYFSTSMLYSIAKFAHKSDVVSLHSPQGELAWCSLISKILNKRVVITHHADLVLPNGITNKIIDILMLTSFYVAAIFSDKIISYSKDYAQNSFYLKPFLRKVVVNHPPILFPIPKQSGVVKLKQSLNIHDETIIGFSGRLVEEKGVDILLKALVHIKKDVDFVFVVAGEKEVHYENKFQDWQKLFSALGNRIKFVGLIKNPQLLANYYAMLDVLVLPSRRECFGIVQVESMLSGTPVIASNIHGGRIPVKKTGMGLLFTSENVKDLSKKITGLLNNPKQYIKNRRLVLQIFSLDKSIENYKNILKLK